MRVGISAQVATAQDAAFVRDAERLGAASVWVPEAWAHDALTPLAYLAAQTSTIRLATGGRADRPPVTGPGGHVRDVVQLLSAAGSCSASVSAARR